MADRSAVSPSILRFDQYELDLRAGRLSKSGVKIDLRDKSFQVLALLLEHAGEVVTREELRQHLWPDDVFVDFDNNLNMTIARLRNALRDSADRPRFIETIPKHGYRFLVSASESVPSERRTAISRVKIVVLPFVNLSGDPAQEYFSDAMTDEIITALAGLAPEHLAVIARTTAMYYKGRQKDVARIRRELGVDYLLEGGIRRSDDRVAINVQLIQTGDQTHLFARKYEAKSDEIFRMQDCIAEAIAAHIPEAAGNIRAGESARNRTTRKAPVDPVAYNFYLLGRQQMLQSIPNPVTAAEKAKRYFDDALARDPEFALGHTAFAEGYWWVGHMGWLPPKEAYSEGTNWALRAIELDHTCGFAHAMLGSFRGRLEYDWDECRREMALALQLEPGNPEIRFRYAEGYLMPQGRIPEAVAELERALESDPFSLYFRFWLGYALYLGRQYARALEQFRFLMDLAPNRHPELSRTLDVGHLGMGWIRGTEGRLEEAIHHFRRAVELSQGQMPCRYGHLGWALARNGNTAEARALLERLEAKAADYFPAMTVAWIHLGLGDIDAAFTWMDRAVEERDSTVRVINTFPLLDSLRSDPRFTALLRKMNLKPQQT